MLLPDVEREYGAKVAAVEPGGAEQIPLAERHGRPIQLLWTWTSPNLEFATVFVGVLGVLVFGLPFWQAVGAIVLGNALGAVFHGVLSSWGPDTGLCQMVLSRRGFGFLGNILPAGLNSLAAGLGWFAVNSVSGALALSALTGLNGYLCLVIVVALMLGIAYFGHNLIQLFERFAFPVLAVIFVIGAAVILHQDRAGSTVGPDPGRVLDRPRRRRSATPPAGIRTPPTTPATCRRASGKAAGWFAARGAVRVLHAAGDGRRRSRHRCRHPELGREPGRLLHQPAAGLARQAHPARDLHRRDRRERVERLLQRAVVHRDRHPVAHAIRPARWSRSGWASADS